jgi:uncharacterized membrane protein
MTTRPSDRDLPFLPRTAVAVEQDERLDPAVDTLGRLTSVFGSPGVRRLLGGDWLGHALHPSLTDLPLGLWTAAGVLDVLGGKRSRPASQRLVGLGVLAALPTAAAGWTEWHRTDRPVQRVGVAHAALNLAAVGAYTESWRARRQGRHGWGVTVALAGATLAAAAGYLGGHLTSARKVSSRHPAFESTPGSGSGEAQAGAATARLAADVGTLGNPTHEKLGPHDVLEVVSAQHAEITRLVNEVDFAAPTDRATALQRFLAYLAGHEAVEEELLHPRGVDTSSPNVATERMGEEEGVGQQIRQLERIGVESPVFRAQFGLIEEAVSKHAEAEEDEELPYIVATLSGAEAALVVRAFRAQEAGARKRSGTFAEMLRAARADVRELASASATR